MRKFFIHGTDNAVSAARMETKHMKDKSDSPRIDWPRILNLGSRDKTTETLMTAKDSELRICVIDDDPDVIRTVERLCRLNGHAILSIDAPIGCSIQINKFKPQIVFIDLSMPSIKGTKLLELLKKTITQPTKFVFFSGTEPCDLERICDREAADGCFFKGEGYGRLISLINFYASELRSAGRNKDYMPKWPFK